MTTLKYAGNIVTDTKPFPQELIDKLKEKHRGAPPPMDSTRLLWLDEEVVKGAFYMEFIWLWQMAAESVTVEEPHQHDFAELIGFIGGDQKTPRDLGGEIEIRLGNRDYFLNKSGLVFIPKGLTHCPIRFKKIGRPILWFTASPNGMYRRTEVTSTESELRANKYNVVDTPVDLSRYIITDMKPGLEFAKPPQDLPPDASSMTRLLWLDNEMASGAFYMECVWYGKGEGMGGPDPHMHDFDEVLGFIGTNRQNPRDLGGTVELWLDNEKHILRKSCLVFIPRGLKHCPMILKDLQTPVFHFSSGNGGRYTKTTS